MTYIEPKFNLALLDATPEEKLAYFKRKVFAHAHLKNTFNLALDNIEFAYSGEIVPIVGPSGVGTTELGRKIWNEYQGPVPTVDECGNVQFNANSIGIEAPHQAGRIDADYWKRLLSGILRRGGDMLIDRKIYVPPSDFILTHPVPYADPLKQGVDTLMLATVGMLKQRDTKVVLINQADRLFPDADQAGCIRSQQILMDLAAQTRTRFVLIGGYQLVRASSVRNNWLCGQHIVHFRRYDKNRPEEYAIFVKALLFLLANLPTELRLKSLSEAGARQIYLRTVGCMGTAKKALMMALQHSLRTGEPMTEDFILRFAPNNLVALGVAKDARLGEALLTDVDSSEVERALDAGSSEQTGDKKAFAATKQPQNGTKEARPCKVVPRIGERKSTRDPVGGRNEVPA